MTRSPGSYNLIEKDGNMKIHSGRLKLAGFAFAFLAGFAGRWFNLYSINQNPLASSLFRGLVYGLAFGFVFFHLVDLFLARGRLQVKLKLVLVTGLSLLTLSLCNRYLVSDSNSPIILAAEFIFILLTGLFSVLADGGTSGKSDYIVSDTMELPGKYSRNRFFLGFLETFFRLLPLPEPVGLYRVGHPDEKSEIILTGNYELTVRRVVRSLKNRNCWLLVCDSRGINIWCSTLADHFNTEKIIEAVERTGLNSFVSHRKIIVPQLCAANISRETIREKTGFRCHFGPVRIDDLEEYLTDKSSSGIREVSFSLLSRMEMAVGTLFIPAMAALFIFNFIDPDRIITVFPLFLLLSLFNAVIFPYRFIGDVRLWSLLYGAALFLISWFICGELMNQTGFFYPVTLFISAVYFVNEFEGWSPLVKFSMTGAYKLAKIEILGDLCTGCGTCMEVCPRGVYSLESGKAQPLFIEKCCSCKSCFIQCPSRAIVHSAQAVDERIKG